MAQNTSSATVILGIDPGSRVAGYGLVRVEGDRVEYLEQGVITARESAPFGHRLLSIGQGLRRVIENFSPDVVVVEKVFMGKNADSAFKLGHARGVCLYEAAQKDCEIVEYSTREVKKGITGSGAASKEQVQTLLGAILNIGMQVSLDASDALALAYHHAREMDVRARLSALYSSEVDL